MKIKAKSKFYPIFFITLFALVTSLSYSAGLAAIKEQSFHNDAGANIVVYSKLAESRLSVKIETTRRTFTIERQKLVGNIELMSVLPVNITTDTELEPIRKAAKEYRDFSIRFPKSAPLLSQNIAALDSYIKGFEGGKARYNGEWMPKEQMLAAKQKEEELRNEVEAAIKRKYEENRLFEESQKAKGLAKYYGKWLPADEVKQFVERNRIALHEAAEKNKADKLASEKRASDAIAEMFARRIEGRVISTTTEGLLVEGNDYNRRFHQQHQQQQREMEQRHREMEWRHQQHQRQQREMEQRQREMEWRQRQQQQQQQQRQQYQRQQREMELRQQRQREIGRRHREIQRRH